MGAELLRAYGRTDIQTDLTKLIVIFRYLRVRLIIFDPPYRQQNPAYTNHSEKSHCVNTVHKTESHHVREKPEE